MIQSAMMFALGIFVSGLVWLAFSVALVRRARRLTEKRLLAGIATRRAEFDAERDELRARHAVQMHRLEREVSRILDTATAYRLEADLKERDLMSARAELDAHREHFSDVETRLMGQRENTHDLERRAAEAGSALRATQHQLTIETKRRAAAEEALDEASVLADQRRLALAALRAENNALRERLGEEPGTPLPLEEDELPRLPRAVTAMDDYDEELPEEPETDAPAEEELEEEELAAVAEDEAVPATMGGSVVQLPTRPRSAPVESPDRPDAAVAEAAHDLKRLADDADADDDEIDVVPAVGQPLMPDAPAPGAAGNIGELVALRMAPTEQEEDAEEAEDADGVEEPEISETAESQFFEALAEIRALKRAGNQAGE